MSAYTFHKLAFDAVSETGANLRNMEQPPPEVTARMELEGAQNVCELLDRFPSVAREWFDKAVEGAWSVTSDVVLHWMANHSALPELQTSPTFLKLRGARRVYVDEAQDCSGSMVKIIQQCTHASVVLAGDTNQDINGFMGAVDPIGRRADFFPQATAFPLSFSWRFHSQIANAFNTITKERCVGRPDRPCTEKGPIVVLCGTNREVDAALAHLQKRNIRAFKRGSVEAAQGGVEVSTVHRAKGGGWTTVVVMPIRRKNVKVAATAVSRARELLYIHYSVAKEYGIATSSHVRRFGGLKELKF